MLIRVSVGLGLEITNFYVINNIKYIVKVSVGLEIYEWLFVISFFDITSSIYSVNQ